MPSRVLLWIGLCGVVLAHVGCTAQREPLAVFEPSYSYIRDTPAELAPSEAYYAHGVVYVDERLAVSDSRGADR